jgi:small conductance mechanosensitive channel
MWERTIQNITANAYDVWLLIQSWAERHLLHIIIILVGAEIFQRIAKKFLSKIIHKTARRRDLYPTELDRKKRVQTLDSLIGATLRIGVFIIASMMIISELGINTGPLIASAGVIGVALGFGAQNLIRDFMSGFFVITENQFRVGDVV